MLIIGQARGLTSDKQFLIEFTQLSSEEGIMPTSQMKKLRLTGAQTHKGNENQH